VGKKPSLASLVVDNQRKKLDAVHGTKYEFDDFELGVNRGTHGQMYGEGIYASNADEIAGSYAPRDVDHEEWMMSQYQAADGDYSMMDAWERALMHETPWSMRELAKDPDIDEATREAYLKVAQALSDNPPKRGHMLRLEIDADAGELLDWDAPLSEQPEFIKVAAKSIEKRRNRPFLKEPTGRDIYYRMVDASTPAQEAPTKIRQALQKIGAKGITYKERNSANAQNYVIFDPKIIEIAERYAMPVTYVGAGGVAALSAQEAEAGVKFPSGSRTIGSEFDPRFDARKREQERLANTTVETLQRSDVENVPQLSLSDLEGRSFVTSMSDRTGAGDFVTAIDGVTLNRPVSRRGGQDFMFENPSVWASAQAPAADIQRKAAEIRQKTKQDPAYIPWRMAPTGGDFAVETGEAMLAYASANMTKAQKRELDRAVRKFATVGSMVKGKRVNAGKKIKGWKGVDDPASVDAWRNAPDVVRKELMNMMDVQFRNKGGLSRGQARLVLADTRQLSARDAGIQNVGVIQEGELQQSSHPSYPFAVPGEGVGRLKNAEDVTIFDLLPDARFGDAQKLVKDPANPTQQEIRALQMKAYSGQITEDILRRLEARGVDVKSIPGLIPAVMGAGAVASTNNAEAAEIPTMEGVTQRFSSNRDRKNRAWTGLKDAVGKMTQPFQPLAEFVAHSAAGMASGAGGAIAYDTTDIPAQTIEQGREFVRGIPEQMGFGPIDQNAYQVALNQAMEGIADTVINDNAMRAFVDPVLQDVGPELLEQYQQLDPRTQGMLSGLGEYIGNAIR